MSRDFVPEDWQTPCPPGYDTVMGWFSRNLPEVMADVLAQNGGDLVVLYDLFAWERQAAAVANAGEGWICVLASPAEMAAISCADAFAYPVEHLERVFSKDIHVPLTTPET